MTTADLLVRICSGMRYYAYPVRKCARAERVSVGVLKKGRQMMARD